MKTKSATLLSTAALVCFALPASAASIFIPISNIVQNGGFETGKFPPWQVSGTTTRAARTATETNCGAFGIDHDSAHSGNWGAFAAPKGSIGYLKQMLNTDPGSAYDLTFWMEENGSDASSLVSGHPVEFQVFWNGSLIWETTTPPTSYTQFTFDDLLATNPCSTLKFGFRDDFGEFHLDDVSVTLSPSQVPEAFSTLWLALPSALMLAWVRSRRKTVMAASAP